ncbi:MAG: hypothetical protein ABI605_15440 [Rhizobacter sp.]
MSVVTSGTQIKFARTGELSLQAIACTVLRSVGGQFFHIGPLDADWLAEIHAHLAANGITPQRFAPLVAVDSLYANKSLGWTTPAQLSGLLQGLAPAHAQLSQEARGFYNARFSRQELLRVLAQLCEA